MLWLSGAPILLEKRRRYFHGSKTGESTCCHGDQWWREEQPATENLERKAANYLWRALQGTQRRREPPTTLSQVQNTSSSSWQLCCYRNNPGIKPFCILPLRQNHDKTVNVLKIRINSEHQVVLIKMCYLRQGHCFPPEQILVLRKIQSSPVVEHSKSVLQASLVHMIIRP